MQDRSSCLVMNQRILEMQIGSKDIAELFNYTQSYRFVEIDCLKRVSSVLICFGIILFEFWRIPSPSLLVFIMHKCLRVSCVKNAF